MARKKPRTDDDPRWTWELPPAPGELRAVHAFVKTAEGREALSSPAALADWLSLWGLAPAALELGAEELERTREARRALRAQIAAHSGEPLDEAAVARLDRALAGIAFRLRFGRAGAIRYEPVADGFDGALARLLATVERHRDGAWRRLKLCREESCGRVYHDFSRSRCSRWCSSRCGARVSSRGYRRRFKQATGRTPGARLRRR